MPGGRVALSDDTTPCEKDRRDDNGEGTLGLARPSATTAADL